MSSPQPVRPSLAFTTAPIGECSAEERTILANAVGDLRKGLDLRRWFDKASHSPGGLERFRLTRTEHDPEISYGFFGIAPMEDGSSMPVMGNVQEMFFDRAKRAPVSLIPPEEMCRQIRDFVLRYFMRISTFLEPEHESGKASSAKARELEGFGYTQHFAKPKDGNIVRFPPEEQCRVTDLRDIGPVWDWIIARIRFHNFQISVRPLGSVGPNVAFDLEPQNYLILSPELIIDRDRPEPGVAGEFGFGYAAIRNPTPGLMAYGPGHFQAAVQMLLWRVLDTGEIRARMEFISNRPKQISRVDVDPVHWFLKAANVGSLGLFKPVLNVVQSVWDNTTRLNATVDPVFAAVDGLNMVTMGKAGRDWSISREQIENQLLLLHFQQHYRAVLGSLRTFRRVSDWTNESTMPSWAKDGLDNE